MVGPHQDNGVPYNNTGTTYGPVGSGITTPQQNFGSNIQIGGTTNNQNNQQGGSNLGVSIHTNQPYETPQVPVTYDLTDMFQDMAAIESQNPKYDLSYGYGDHGDGSGMPLGGKFYAQDSSGNPIYDSSGNLVLTGTGGHMMSELQDAGMIGSNQTILKPEELQSIVSGMTHEDLGTFYDDYYRQYTAPGGEGGYTRYGYGPSGRDRKLDLLRFLNKGAPIKQIEQQGFFDSMVNPYAQDTQKSINEGIFSGILNAGVYDSNALRRLIGSYGSGVAKPRYTNVAKGGIISLLGE